MQDNKIYSEQDVQQLKNTIANQESLIEDQQTMINTLKKSEIQIQEAARQITEENAKIKNENTMLVQKNKDIRKESKDMEDDYFEQQKFYQQHIIKLETRIKKYKQTELNFKQELENKIKELDLQQERNLLLQINNCENRNSLSQDQLSLLRISSQNQNSENNLNSSDQIDKVIGEFNQDFNIDLQEQMNVDEEKFQKMQKETQKLQRIFQECQQLQKPLTKKEVINIILDNLPQSQYQDSVQETQFKEDKFLIEKYEYIWLNEVMPLFENELQNKPKIIEKSKELISKNKLVQKFRGQIWKCLVGNDIQLSDKLMIQLIQSFPNNQFLEKNIQYTIKADLSRTYTFINKMEQSEQLKQDLQDLLYCMACFRPDIGYVQGMAYFALQFLLRMPKIDAFIAFVNLFSKSNFLMTIFRFQNPRMDAYFNYFSKQLEQKIPDLHEHFEELNVQKMTFLIEWAFTLYGRAFEFEIVSQIWDMFFAFGDQIFFRTGLAILYTVKNQIISCQYEDCMVLLNNCSYLVSKVDLFKNMDRFKCTQKQFEQGIEKEILLIQQENQEKIRQKEKEDLEKQEQQDQNNQNNNNDIVYFGNEQNLNEKQQTQDNELQK